jgi:hypothetical protein
MNWEVFVAKIQEVLRTLHLSAHHASANGAAVDI